MHLYERSVAYYDLIYGPIVDYERETDLLERIFADHAARPVQRVLDLGCGTGNHSILLAQRGYEVLGLDRSEAFIRVATQKTRTLDTPPRFVVGDMRELDEVGRFDALISMFGAIGHVPRGSVSETLAGFKRVLEPGGVLAFEWWNVSGAKDGHQDWLERSDDVLRLIRLGRARVDATQPSVHLTLRHLILRNNNLEEDFTEEGTLSLYGLEEMEGLLTDAGLTPVTVLDWTNKKLEPYVSGGFRAFAVARQDG